MKMMAGRPRAVNVEQISFEKLASNDDSVLETIEKAYSERGMGTLAIHGIPEYTDKRRKCLL
jgi:hypothetical protein